LSDIPRGTFQWRVLRPVDQTSPALILDAAVAIVGEDAMKKRLVDEKA
jgi:hypothetical protein